jgi:putative nucleotidyltransferase with HDIG domain
MANGSQRKTRSERVAALELPPGRLERAWLGLCHRDVLLRLALAFAAAAAVCVIIQAWDPPLHWRTGMVPTRFITARVDFKEEKPEETAQKRRLAREETKAVFIQDVKPLEQLRADLRNTIAELTKTETLTEKTAPIWKEFQTPQSQQPQPPTEGAKPPAPQADAAAFQEFRKAMAGKENLDRLDRSIADAFAPFEHRGLLVDLTKNLEGYNKKTIVVYTADNPGERREIEVRYVTPDPKEIKQTLTDDLGSKAIADRIYNWLEPRLLHASQLSTFTLDVKASQAAQEENANKVEQVVIDHKAGFPLVAARESIDKSKLDLLELERAAYLAKRTVLERTSRCLAVLMVVFALFTLCGMYMRYRQRGVQAGLDRLAGALALAVATVFLAVAVDPYRAELVGVILFGMIVAIAYRAELALLFSGVVSWIVVLALGGDLPMFLLLFGTTAAAVLNLWRIRSRSKLVYVGLFAGCVAALLDVAMKLIDNQPLNWSLFRDAGHQFLWALFAGFLMTGLLPFVERLFGVLTDLSLLELGDITHPLLQELVRRAPSTYNHSITVGSIAEAAAEAIGARGLICRVGAYFHDIGKMLKPGYFVENQGKEGNRHDGLVPAMSTLVIIAHIKDGADLARQHHLPQPIIDMIEQHHGTMLMEYFYDRAQTQHAADANGSEVDENLFRYPGPKPQSKEAAVLMLSDAVESASRTLVDPTPGRIEGLVGDLAQRRLQAGQFDESGLTLRELGTIERSLAMSVASIYHGRLKYPEQRTA